MKIRAISVRRQHVLHALLEPMHELVAERITKGRVGDNGYALEEAGWADALRAVDDLAGEDEVSGADLLAQRAYSGKCQDRTNAERLQGGNVGASRHRGGVNSVPNAVACKESDLSARRERRDGNRGAWKAPGLRSFR